MSFEKSLHLVYITLHIITKMHGEIITPSSTSKYETHSCVGNENCTINCGSDGTPGSDGYCEDDTIHCPASPYPCAVNCNGYKACAHSNIIWGNNPGLDTLTCIGDVACQGVTFPILDPTTAVNITCQGFATCDFATIYCPSDADCDVYCEGDGPCRSATINGPLNGNLWVQCTGSYSCGSTQFNCPSESGHCSVKCDSDNCGEGIFIYPT
eukprot:215066_1